MNRTQKNHTRDLAYIALCAALMTVCSWIAIPAPIPFTLQTFGLFVTVGLLGGRRGSLAVLVYLTLGLIGVPVFAGFTGGIGILASERGGYLIGLFLSALVMWGIERLCRRSTRALLAAMVAGLIVCYVFGTAWFTLAHAKGNSTSGVWTALSLCILPYIIPDGIKIALALHLCKRSSSTFSVGSSGHIFSSKSDDHS